MEERLQKLLSGAGLCSRRQAEQWILAGRVTVNQQVAGLGDKADLAKDQVCVDQIPLKQEKNPCYLMLNKPRGYVTTLSDQEGRKTVADLVAGCGRRLWPVGRLDLNSEGLLLMTDDGDLTHKILHPSHQVEKEYLVWARGEAEVLDKCGQALAAPLWLEGDRVQAVAVAVKQRKEGGVLLSVTICQGKNRQVRRMCQQVGLEVTRLKRIREGGLKLDPSLEPGKWRPLRLEEVALLQGEGKGNHP